MITPGILELPKAIRESPPSLSFFMFRRMIALQSFNILFQSKKMEQTNCVASDCLQNEKSFYDNFECNCRKKLQVLDQKVETSLQKRHSLSVSDYEIEDYPSKTILKSLTCKRAFQKLIPVVEKVFLCNELQFEDLQLATSELELLKEVINKKFGSTFKDASSFFDTNKDQSELLDRVNKMLLKHKSAKRVEENNKFIYKYTMKYLRKQFYAKKGLKNSKTTEIMFYEHYFSQISEQNNMKLDNFFDPLYKTLNKNPSYKTINNKYLSLIFSSTHFKCDFFDFLKFNFKNTYNQMVPFKLKKFFKKLRSDVVSTQASLDSKEDLLKKFTDKLRYNRKCKLPWTYKEIACAIAQFASLIYYY